MQRFKYLLIFAIVLLLFKAFFLDEYLEKRAMENNTSSETSEVVEEEPNQSIVLVEPNQSNVQDMNITGMSAEKKSIPQIPEDKKMPLDQLGDSLTKHIKL
ncbi:hypothetical protein [Sulfuricurvum sp.]|uniref:hypothetical protein n=1 Tax=Sulfuricurvum sp. TaxID=2025608 RepID=UPI00261E884D|nr:hypothetical protein [Sulfuricurvum sp.]MDD2266844.1 hypothetical protein [Sulfuricurvum sp.]MDD2783851.1 hypothetical protein [Sulfuricurvum sp.]